jgi:hypothetical protein
VWVVGRQCSSGARDQVAHAVWAVRRIRRHFGGFPAT